VSGSSSHVVMIGSVWFLRKWNRNNQLPALLYGKTVCGREYEIIRLIYIREHRKLKFQPHRGHNSRPL